MAKRGEETLARRVGTRVVGLFVLLAACAGPGPMAEAAEAGCAGPIVASGVLAGPVPATGTMRPALMLATADGGGPKGVGLDGVLLPAAAGASARAALIAALTARAGTAVSVRGERVALDRRGRVGGQVLGADGEWLQGALLEAGLVVAEAAGGPCDGALLAAEATARAQRRGIWAERGLIQPSRGWDAEILPDFVVIEGRAQSIGKSGGTTYVNFGGRFAEDATVRIRAAVATALAEAGTDVDGLAGRWIRVRGFATGRDGMDLPLASASALEAVDDAESR